MTILHTKDVQKKIRTRLVEACSVSSSRLDFKYKEVNKYGLFVDITRETRKVSFHTELIIPSLLAYF